MSSFGTIYGDPERDRRTGMFKGLVLGIVIGILLLVGCMYLYFSLGFAPVATAAHPMPLERRLAKLALHAYLDKQQHSRSEEHTSELQSQSNLVCRLLLEKKKKH